jgi:Raf kinase inhibitor-like YbhB/YbcL family protein
MPAVPRVAGALVLAASLACCGGSSTPPAPPRVPATLDVHSPDFANGAAIPRRESCDGAGVRPALSWSGVPAGARELAIVVTDPDARGFVHWTAWGIPPSARGLGRAARPGGLREGASSTGRRGWTPPCPPRGGGAHRYVFRLYWLRRPLGLAPGSTPDAVLRAIGSTAGGEGVLVGRYRR